MEDPWQFLPLKLADLREACTGTAALEPILNVEDGCFVLLAKRKPLRRSEFKLFDCELHLGAERNRLVNDPPLTIAGRLDRLDLVAPARVVKRIDYQGPDRLGWARDLDGFLNPDDGTLASCRSRVKGDVAP